MNKKPKMLKDKQTLQHNTLTATCVQLYTQHSGNPYLVLTGCLRFGPKAQRHHVAGLDAARGGMPMALIRFLPGSQVSEAMCKDLCYLVLTVGGIGEPVSGGTSWLSVRHR